MTPLLHIVLAIAASAVASTNAFAYCPTNGSGRALGQRVELAMPMLGAGPNSPLGKGSCPDDACNAAVDLYCAAVAIDGVLTPNSLAYLTPQGAQDAWNERKRVVRAFGYAHPSRVPLYCTYLTRLAALTPDQPRRDGDNSVRFNIELAVRLWPLDRTCPGKVKAAFPDTPTIHATMADQDAVCLDRPAWCLPRLIPPVRLAPSRRHATRNPG